jgi:hypothetical protein
MGRKYVPVFLYGHWESLCTQEFRWILIPNPNGVFYTLCWMSVTHDLPLFRGVCKVCFKLPFCLKFCIELYLKDQTPCLHISDKSFILQHIKTSKNEIMGSICNQRLFCKYRIITFLIIIGCSRLKVLCSKLICQTRSHDLPWGKDWISKHIIHIFIHGNKSKLIQSMERWYILWLKSKKWKYYGQLFLMLNIQRLD